MSVVGPAQARANEPVEPSAATSAASTDPTTTLPPTTLPPTTLPPTTLPTTTLPTMNTTGTTTAVPGVDAVEGVYRLRFDPIVDGVATGAMILAYVLTEGPFKTALAPTTCRWCDRDAGGGDTLNGLDAWGRGIRAPTLAGQKDAAWASDVILFGGLPALLVGLEAALAGPQAGWAAFAEDVVIIAEAGFASALLNQATKFAVGRERPFVHVLPESEKSTTEKPNDNNLSFYSGHASFGFAIATAAGTVAELRGYRHRWVVWAVGLPVAASLPILRMVADKHYLTDVTTGVVLGAAVGFAVPYFLHPRLGERLPVTFSAGPDGVLVAGRF